MCCPSRWLHHPVPDSVPEAPGADGPRDWDHHGVRRVAGGPHPSPPRAAGRCRTSQARPAAAVLSALWRRLRLSVVSCLPLGATASATIIIVVVVAINIIDVTVAVLGNFDNCFRSDTFIYSFISSLFFCC